MKNLHNSATSQRDENVSKTVFVLNSSRIEKLLAS